MSKKRGVTLTEVIVVTAIILVVCGILFPVYSDREPPPYRLVCHTNLRHIGLAMSEYRLDWNNQNPPNQLQGKPFAGATWLAWDLLNPYAARTDVFHCPNDSDYPKRSPGYFYRSGYRNMATRERALIGLDPSSITAYCLSHLQSNLHVAPEGQYYADPIVDKDGKYIGRFLFLRFDGSASSCDAKQVESWMTDGLRWYLKGTEPAGIFYRVERFPGESWPPEFQL